MVWRARPGSSPTKEGGRRGSSPTSDSTFSSLPSSPSMDGRPGSAGVRLPGSSPLRSAGSPPLEFELGGARGGAHKAASPDGPLRAASALRRSPPACTVLSISLADISWVARLGEGDYGEVWLCRHEGAKRHMAVKMINEKLLSAECRAAFLREIRLLSSLRHANLVKVYGACDSPSRGLCLFVELCAGSWRARLSEPEPIAPATLVSVLRGVAAGMAYLHRKGIVHRDLKSANVLLRGARAEDDAEFAVVSDMGLARYVDVGGPAMTVCGTAWVMAPEMLAHGRYDALPCDVFAFGVLIAESVTRLDAEEVPRTGRFLVSWAELAQHAAVQAATGRRRACYERLLDLAAECCVHAPASRPRFAALVETLGCHAAQLRDEPGGEPGASAAPCASSCHAETGLDLGPLSGLTLASVLGRSAGFCPAASALGMPAELTATL